MITYAQNFEDVMLARIFEGRRDGFYVDVGAGDPVHLSVTKWLYDLGWSGINVEPNRALYQRLVSERPRDVNLAVGAGARRGEATFHEFPVKELSSFDSNIHKSAENPGVETGVRTVPILSLSEILEQHGKGRHVDFVKIDVEGWEKEVLSGLDLRRHRPTLIIVEATVPETRIESHPEWEGLLTSHGFSCAYFDGLNRFYVADENTELKRHFALPPNVFDEITSFQLVEAKAQVDELKYEVDRLRAEVDRLKTSYAMLMDEVSRLKALESLQADELGAAVRGLLEKLADALDRGRRRASVREAIKTNEAAMQVVGDAILTLRSRKASLRHFLVLATTKP